MVLNFDLIRDTLKVLKSRGVLSRVGPRPVFYHKRLSKRRRMPYENKNINFKASQVSIGRIGVGANKRAVYAVVVGW